MCAQRVGAHGIMAAIPEKKKGKIVRAGAFRKSLNRLIRPERAPAAVLKLFQKCKTLVPRDSCSAAFNYSRGPRPSRPVPAQSVRLLYGGGGGGGGCN